MTAAVCGSRSTRRTKAEITTIKAAIYNALEEEHPATVRGLYYVLVSRGVVPKTEAAYKSTVVRLAGEMRKAGELPYWWLADNTRMMRKPRSYNGVEDVLRQTAQLYRHSLWNDADAYVEVWSEKDAISGVLYDVTATWDVPLMVTRGYPSITFLHAAAETIAYIDKAVFLYYFGDHDPTGVHIPVHVEKEIRSMAPGAEVHFERVAVTEGQIEEYGLQTRPTKRSDSRSKGFVGESVEVDAIPPSTLRALAESRIQGHVDGHQLAALVAAEESERKSLLVLADRVGGTLTRGGVGRRTR